MKIYDYPTTYTIEETDSFYLYRKSRSSGKSNFRPNPFYFRTGTSSGDDAIARFSVRNSPHYELANSPASIRGYGPKYNQCYDKFIAKIHTTCQIGASAGEAGKTFDMLAKTFTRLHKAYKAVRKGNFVTAAKTLGCPNPYPPGSKKRRQIPKDAGKRWLAYHYGWKPLVQEIYDTVKILSESRPPSRVKASVRGSDQYDSGLADKWQWHTDYSVFYRISMQADIYVDNPNAALCNQMGLVNPVGIAWELVPFSFVVDWFVPVGNIINSYSDYVGLRVENGMTTVGSEVHSNWLYVDYGVFEVGMPPRYNFSSGRGSFFGVERTLGNPSPMWYPPQLPGGQLSITRAAVAVALLVQGFSSR